MAERLLIKNFAGIDEIDIELGRINIFIGAQASGKSICVKCLFYFKGCINSLLRQALLPRLPIDKLDTLFATGFDLMFESTAWQYGSVLRYTNGENFIQLTEANNKVKVSFSNFYQNLFERAKETALTHTAFSPEDSAFLDAALYKRFKQEAEKTLGQAGTSTLLFVPASRATYALSLASKTNDQYLFSTDNFINNFAQFYNIFKRNKSSIREGLSGTLINSLAGEILQAEFKREDEEDFLIQPSGKKTPLTIASSGQQEVLPVVLALQYLAFMADFEPQAVTIEEPEAHLHPTAQNALAQLMAAVYNIRTAPLQFFITTHTPYLLSSFNNLIYAGQLANALADDDIAGQEQLYAIVPKELHLNLADFRVYGLEDGKSTLLIDEEFGLLMAHSIDSVSDIIADQFGDLMALDPANKPSVAD
ncbi:MAG: hypothetical protein EOO61_12755 [Hymenobacter sp.]|nr:MAG: hypothetical protein EOO61_12755 [Hymenobacter sp.]